MSDFAGTTRAQTIFLRAFRQNSFGPAPSDWPSPAVLRRWLRKPGFHRAFHDLRQAIRAQADFLLASAAAQAATRISQAQDSALRTQDLTALRLAHLRQRFPTDPPPPTATNLKIVKFLREQCADAWTSADILDELERRRLIPPQDDPDDQNDDDDFDDEDDEE